MAHIAAKLHFVTLHPLEVTTFRQVRGGSRGNAFDTLMMNCVVSAFVLHSDVLPKQAIIT